MKPYNRKKLFLFPLGGLALLALISYVVMQLWNHLLPDILHVTTINFWQAAGIFVLSKILFGFGGPRGGGAPWMRRKQMMEERFRNMGPEERARFKEQWQNRCGSWGKRRWDWQDKKEEVKAEASGSSANAD